MSTSLEFHGAADVVTGSKTLVRLKKTMLMIDCGLYQGAKALRERNWSSYTEFNKVDSVVITHAHLDHIGYLPRLFQQGFTGKIYLTDATAELATIILYDAAYLEEEASQYANKSGYSNHKPALPLYSKSDVEEVIKLFVTKPRDEWFTVEEDVHIRFRRSGHIIGSSFVDIDIKGGKNRKRITFSGDFGTKRSHFLKGPVYLNETDVLVLESTYGDRLIPRDDTLKQLEDIINKVHKRNGVLIIPAFAVGRSQEMIYLIRRLEEDGKIPIQPVVLDSPMAIRATEIAINHKEDHTLDTSFLGAGDNFHPRMFELSQSADDSFLNCMREGPFIVVSASGMLSGGRVLHHLKKRLPEPENCVLFCGYQADSTKGRFLQDNEGNLENIRIHHMEVPIRAQIETISALSAHGDYEEMLEWIEHFDKKPEKIILNHGNPEAQKNLAKLIDEKFGIETICAAETSVIGIFE